MRNFRGAGSAGFRHAWARQPAFVTPLRHATALVAAGTMSLVAGCSRSGTEQNALRPHGSISSSDRYDARTGSSASPRVYADHHSIPKGGGTYKLGSPYRIANRWYLPAEDPNYDRTGIASWYGADFHGRKTANGEVYDMNRLSAAHPTLPLPSYAYVTSLKTGRTVLVRVNDRGPYAAERIMDLSKQTAEALGIAGAGISQVRVKYAGRAPLNGDDTTERRFLASQPWANQTIAHAPPPGRMGLTR